MAIQEDLVIATLAARALSNAVTISATAPTGWTTISGASDSETTCKTEASAMSPVPESQRLRPNRAFRFLRLKRPVIGDEVRLSNASF